MRKSWWASSEWNAICDQCGAKRKSSQLIERWDGLMVCKPTVNSGCWEPRHPQDSIRPMPDQQKLPWTRPESTDVFVIGICTATGRQGLSGYGTSGCMLSGFDFGYRAIPTPVSGL